MKSKWSPGWSAQTSRARLANSEPLSTVMEAVFWPTVVSRFDPPETLIRQARLRLPAPGHSHIGLCLPCSVAVDCSHQCLCRRCVGHTLCGAGIQERLEVFIRVVHHQLTPGASARRIWTTFTPPGACKLRYGDENIRPNRKPRCSCGQAVRNLPVFPGRARSVRCRNRCPDDATCQNWPNGTGANSASGQGLTAIDPSISSA